MKIYHAEVEYTTRVIVKVVIPDDEEPTDEDIWESLSYAQNHLDEQTFDEQIISVEQAEE
jgi:hypothetical protein